MFTIPRIFLKLLVTDVSLTDDPGPLQSLVCASCPLENFPTGLSFSSCPWMKKPLNCSSPTPWIVTGMRKIFFNQTSDIYILSSG